MAAIQQNSDVLKNKIKGVQHNGLALKYVKNQTDDICIAAVQQNSDALKYVKNQTEEICIAAVQQN